MTRGVEKRPLFRDDADYRQFASLMKLAKERHPVSILAWCLMPNHVHLLVLDADGDLSEFMHLLCGMYAQYFNARWDRVGHLFQSRFKSIPVEHEPYLVVLNNYIHNNPVGSLVQNPSAYRWSSYHEYLGVSDICDTGHILSLLGGVEGFVESVGVRARGAADNQDSESSQLDIQSAAMLLGVECAQAVLLPEKQKVHVLKTLRSAGYTVQQIADYSGLSKSTVSRICVA